MTNPNPLIHIRWSVWDDSPNVCWSCNDSLVTVVLQRPPVAVSNLSNISTIAIVGSPKEFGSANLLFYSYDGQLKKTFSAPSIAIETNFGGVDENEEGIRIVIDCRGELGWNEQAGQLNLDDGTVTKLHRNY